jgi:hypothetical protein
VDAHHRNAQNSQVKDFGRIRLSSINEFSLSPSPPIYMGERWFEKKMIFLEGVECVIQVALSDSSLSEPRNHEFIYTYFAKN